MVASATYQNTGFFTPLYHIASLLVPPDTMMRSASAAAEGTTFLFVAGPAAVGLLIHMVVGATYGAVFAVALSRLPVGGVGPRLAVGAAFGVFVFALSFVLLPLMSNIAQGPEAIRDMASMVGYPTFLAEHVLFGLVAGGLIGDVTVESVTDSRRRVKA